jgi:hypothetical protein
MTMTSDGRLLDCDKIVKMREAEGAVLFEKFKMDIMDFLKTGNIPEQKHLKPLNKLKYKCKKWVHSYTFK